MEAAHPGARARMKFNEALRHVIDHLVSDLITNTETLVEQSGARTDDDIRRVPQRLARFSESARAQNAQLKGFLFSHIYGHPLITGDSHRSVTCLSELFPYYFHHPPPMPEPPVQHSQH